jgi:hypothetical protein
MAEYINVEKPFLEKLKQAHWQVIDQGQGVPVNQEKFVLSISYTNLEADLAPDLAPDLTPDLIPHDLPQYELRYELQYEQPQLQYQLQPQLQTEQYDLQYEQPQFDIQAIYLVIESKLGPSRDKIGTKSAQNRDQAETKLKRVLKTQK